MLLGIWSAFFWSTPTADDVVALVEGTSISTVLRRGFPHESTKKEDRQQQQQQQQPEPSETNEERHYYVDVKKCLMEHVTREPGGTYEEGEVFRIKSWSMSYTKKRCPLGSGNGASDTLGEESLWGKKKKKNNAWKIDIRSFIVNGKEVPRPANQLSFLYVSEPCHSKQSGCTT